jgi:limonene 1,2-monooxygenase
MHAPRLRFGIFLAPFHPVHENPTVALERDFALVEHLDRLGYDEAWIGEHHSAGYEIIPSPEVFIAAAAVRTRHIRLGTGVSSLPYHQPLMLADRIQQLDHQTRGRVMFGVGPGQLPSDAFMMGIDVAKQRPMMDESLAALVPLLSGEKITMKTDWFTLEEAQLQLPPYTLPHVEMAVAASISPAGPRAAGKYGTGLLSVAASSVDGFSALANAWQICEAKAREHGQTVSRANWRLVAPMHVAETREQAIEDVRYGLLDFLAYFRQILPTPLPAGTTVEAAVEMLGQRGIGVVGTPDDAIAQIERLGQQSGGFGTMLFLAHNWASFERTQKSYELVARYVMPHFQGLNRNRVASLEWAKSNSQRFIGAAVGAIASEIQKHAVETQAKAAGQGAAKTAGAAVAPAKTDGAAA